MDVSVFKDKHISRWVDRENLIYIRWNSIKNCIKTKMIDRDKKRSKILNQVKSVKIIGKNLQSFPDTSIVEKEVLTSPKLQDRACE